MWPRWMPTVAMARTAARLLARPMAAATWASWPASLMPSMRSESRAAGCTRSVPPTVPSAIGSSTLPASMCPSRRHVASGEYWPERAA